ncbi:MAG: aminotransferase class IV [Solirubrobacteraceae bacterium]
MLPERPDPAAGVYETVRVHDGRIHALDAHLDRLARSVRELYDAPLGDEPRRLLARDASALAGTHRLRIDAIPAPDGLRFETSTSPSAPAGLIPVALRPATVAGGLGAHKWRDRRLLDSLGDDPLPLLVDERGWVLEAARANVWTLRDGLLSTPPADGRILPGVTRAVLLKRAGELGLTAVQRPLALDELRGADAVILTSSVRLAVAAALGAPPPEPSLLPRIRALLAGS